MQKVLLVCICITFILTCLYYHTSIFPPLHRSVGVEPLELQQKPSVLIVQVDTRGIPENMPNWPHLTAEQVQNMSSPFSTSPIINRAYACKHGYDYKMLTPFSSQNKNETSTEAWNVCKHLETGNRRSSAWCKVLGMAVGIAKGYEYVLFLDTDALFIDHSKTLETFMKENENKGLINPFTKQKGPLLSNATMIVTTDWNRDAIRRHNITINSGVVLLRNDQNAMGILKQWWHMGAHEKWNTRFDFDQHVIGNNVLADPIWSKFICRLPSGGMNAPFGSWIVHNSGGRRKQYKQLYTLLKKRGELEIDFSKCPGTFSEQMNSTDVALKLMSTI